MTRSRLFSLVGPKLRRENEKEKKERNIRQDRVGGDAIIELYTEQYDLGLEFRSVYLKQS